MKIKNIFLLTLLIAMFSFAEQGPSIRLFGEPARSNIVIFGEGRTIIDSGISIPDIVDKQYPIFELDLIYYDPVTRDFVIGTELELKASTNNFATTTTNFAYWGDTLYAGETGYINFTNSDAGMKVYYSDYTNSNSRIMKTYVTSTTNVHLTDAIGLDGYVTTVLVSPSRSNHNGQAYSWMTESNTNVVWVWRPRGAIDAGPYTADGKAIWYPCRPKEWASAPLHY